MDAYLPEMFLCVYFKKYPSTFQEDLKLLEKLGDVHVYSPNVTDIYPDGILSRSFNFALSIVCSEIFINSLLTNMS